MAADVDDALNDARARAGLRRNPKPPLYVEIGAEPRTLSGEVIERLNPLVAKIVLVARTAKASELDRAFRKVLGIYQLREKVRKKQ